MAQAGVSPSAPLRGYPCLCLWRGFLQMMRTRPCRRTILQFSQRTLIDGLTFIALPGYLNR